MANDHKKRISNRHSIKGPITLYSTIGTSKEFDAHLLNFSKQGICFTTKTKMVPGTTILFKASKDCHLFAEDHVECELRSFRITVQDGPSISLFEEKLERKDQGTKFLALPFNEGSQPY